MAENKKYNFAGLDDLERMPESQGDLMPQNGTPEVGQLEAGVRGAAQGLSLGFSEEGLAGLQTATDLGETGLSWDKIKEAYNRHAEEQRAREKGAREQNPITYHGAEFGVPLLIPALGALGTAGKLGRIGGAVAEAANVINVPGKVVEGVGAGLSGVKKLGDIGRITAGAVEGATVGGAYGVGKAESPLLSKETLQSGLESAKFGGMLGGGLSTLGVGAKELAIKGLTNNGLAGDISRSYMSAIEGKNLLDFDKVVNQTYEYGQITGNKLLINEVGRIKDAFNRLEQSGDKKANIQEIFTSLKKMREDAKYANDPDAQKIIQGITDTLENKAYGLEQIVEKQQMVLKKTEVPGQEGVSSSRQKLEEQLPLLRAQYESKGYVPEIVEKVDPQTGRAMEQIVLKPIQRTSGGGEKPFGPQSVLENSPENKSKLEELAAKQASKAESSGMPYSSQIEEDAERGLYRLRGTTNEEPMSLQDKEFKPVYKTEEVLPTEPRIDTSIESEPMFVKERPGNTPELGMDDLVELEKLYGQRSYGAQGGTPENEIYGATDKMFTGEVNKLSPEYAQTREQFKQMSRAFDDVNIDPSKALQLDVGSPELKEIINRVAPGEMKKVNDLIVKKLEGGLEGKIAEQELEAFFNRLQKSGAGNIPEIQAKLEENMKDYLLSQKMNAGKIAPAVASYNPNVALLGLLKSYGMKGAHQIGLAQQNPVVQRTLGIAAGTLGHDISPEAKNPIQDFSRTISNSNDEELGQMSSVLKQDKNLSHYGQALEKALMTDNKMLKNSTIFAISQNPNARKLLQGIK